MLAGAEAIRGFAPPDAASLRYAVSPVEFEKQLDYLNQNGYTTIDSRTLDHALRTNGKK